MTIEQYKNEIINYNPDCVGISLLTSEYCSILDTAASVVKSINSNILTIAGGVHVTTQYCNVMKNKNIDFAIRGEGEYVFRDFLDYINGEKERPKKGLVYREKNDEIIALQPDIVQDLDDLPLPNYDLVDYKAYINTGPRYGVDSVNIYPYARLLTSRDCPVGCSFCQVKSISGNKWRARSPEKIVGELELLKNKYGIKAFIFEDDNPFYKKERTMKMLQLLKDRRLDLKWKAAGVAVFKMDEDIFKLMSETGCLMIGIAIESGVEHVLKNIVKKPIDLGKVPKMIRLAQKYGIYVAANCIIGFPGETWDYIRQTLHYAETCGADYCKIYPANPLVNTDLFETVKKQKCKDNRYYC